LVEIKFDVDQVYLLLKKINYEKYRFFVNLVDK